MACFDPVRINVAGWHLCFSLSLAPKAVMRANATLFSLAACTHIPRALFRGARHLPKYAFGPFWRDREAGSRVLGGGGVAPPAAAFH